MACERRLVDDSAVRPLRRRKRIDFAMNTAGVEALLSVGTVETNETRHYERRLARAVGNENVDARTSRASAGKRRLENHGVGGIVRHGDARDFADL